MSSKFPYREGDDADFLELMCVHLHLKQAVKIAKVLPQTYCKVWDT